MPKWWTGSDRMLTCGRLGSVSAAEVGNAGYRIVSCVWQKSVCSVVSKLINCCADLVTERLR